MSNTTAGPPSATEQIIHDIATTEGVDPTELPPMFSTLDTNALDTVIESATQRGTDIELAFSYHGYDVMISGTGGVHLAKNSSRP